jgi:transposase
VLLLKVEKKLRLLMQEVEYSDQAKLVTSAPGIGSVNAAMFVLEVGDIRRFKGFDQLNDFVGLCPDSKSSGETNRHTGITSRRHKQLRRCLVQAAWQSVRRDPAMLEAFQQLCNRMSSNKAIIRIARKLLRRIRRILLTGIPYQMGVVN